MPATHCTSGWSILWQHHSSTIVSISINTQCSYVPKVASVVWACAPWTYWLLVFVCTYGLESSYHWLLVLQPQSLSWMMGVQEQRLAGRRESPKVMNVECCSPDLYIPTIRSPWHKSTHGCTFGKLAEGGHWAVFDVQVVNPLSVIFDWLEAWMKNWCCWPI